MRRTFRCLVFNRTHSVVSFVHSLVHSLILSLHSVIPFGCYIVAPRTQTSDGKGELRSRSDAERFPNSLRTLWSYSKLFLSAISFSKKVFGKILVRGSPYPFIRDASKFEVWGPHLLPHYQRHRTQLILWFRFLSFRIKITAQWLNLDANHTFRWLRAHSCELCGDALGH